MVKYFRLFGLALVVFAHCGALSSPAVRKPPQSASLDLDQAAQPKTDDKRMRQEADVTNLAVSEERAAFNVGPPTEKGINRLISKLANWHWVKDAWQKLKTSKLVKALGRWLFKKRILNMGVPKGRMLTFDEKVVIAKVLVHKVDTHEEMYTQGIRPDHVAAGLGLTVNDLETTGGAAQLEKIKERVLYETFKDHAEKKQEALKT
uniref:RxLR effector protein n=1 Tax=Peronospora matthiolae TaxID=2874970 RepID=A0AAV1VD66_9STRA